MKCKILCSCISVAMDIIFFLNLTLFSESVQTPHDFF